VCRAIAGTVLAGLTAVRALRIVAFGFALAWLGPAELHAAPSPKIHASLHEMLDALPGTAASARLPTDAAGRVRVVIEVDPMTARLRERLDRLGCRVERQRRDLVQAWLPRAALDEIAAMPEVRRLRAADGISSNRAGASGVRADAVELRDLRRRFGVAGRGVRVAVISIGVRGLAESVTAGRLPSTTFSCRAGAGTVTRRTSGCGPGEGLIETSGGITARSFRDDRDLAPREAGGAEGTAALEIVHRLAPEAELWFVNVGTGLDLLDAVDALAANVDVIVSDIVVHTYFPDGRNVIAQTVADILAGANARVRAFVQPAGNLARAHPEAEYRLLLVDCESGASLVAAAEARQGAREPPDVAWYENPSRTAGADVCYAIRRAAARPGSAMLNVTILDPSGEIRHAFNTEAKSVLPPADAHAPLVVLGAVPLFAPDRIEPFSSRGPTFDGRPRPHAVAFDRLPVSGSGGFETVFTGTSAAAAYVGGAVALLLELDPRLTPRELQAVLMHTAVPLDGVNTYGVGRVDPLAAAESIRGRHARPATPSRRWSADRRRLERDATGRAIAISPGP